MRRGVVVTSALMLALSGCFSAPVPMRSVRYQLQPDARCLVVLMPGAGDQAEEFETRGFVQRLRDSGLSLDVVSANATLGYYFKGTVRERVETDVVLPARARGRHQQTWVMGMSMGGFGSLFYAQLHPGAVDGVLALAPYVGRQALATEIRQAGGLSKWHAPAIAEPTEDNYQDQLWRWLQSVTSGAEPGPALYVGWGRDDSLGQADALLAEALPKDHVFSTEGGHDWPPWNRLLEQFLAQGDFRRACQAAAP